jgi:type I restriction enzyme S subunit
MVLFPLTLQKLKSMSKWKETELRIHINHKKGFAFKSSSYQNNGRLIVRVSDSTMNSVNIKSCVKIDEKTALQFKDYELKKDDIVIMTVGSWPENPASVVGKVIRIPKEADGALLNQNAVRIRNNDTIDIHFLYYKLKSSDFSGYIVNTAQGSANQASITLEDIFNYKFLLPSPTEQKAISNILKTIDDKIDLLHRQNIILEKMAETLFRQWFIEEANEDWEEGSIYNFVDVIYGFPFKSKYFNTDKIGLPLIRIRDLKAGFSNIYTSEEFDSKFILNNGDLVAGMDGEFRLYIWSGVKSALNQRACKFVPKFEYVPDLFVFSLMKPHLHYFENTKAGTTVIHLGKADLDDIKVSIPPKDLLIKYGNETKGWFSKLKNNNIQIRTLTSLRDMLLPKLMCDEITVEI